MIRGKSHVIVSTNEVLRDCKIVALEIEVGVAELSAGAELFDWWVEFLLMINSKWTCHFTATVERVSE